METVLGLSLTATKVRTVLVEGRGADGLTVDSNESDAISGGMSATRACEQVAETALSMASAGGHRLHAIGVTWSDEADLEASLVLNSLVDVGFRNVVAVAPSQAAEALARGIGRGVGHRRTAVCVVEPDTTILSLVDMSDGEVQTTCHQPADSEDLVEWVASVFGDDPWRPDGLYVAGAVDGPGELTARLERRLGFPVFNPPEADFALAHGAALASADGPRGEPVAAPIAVEVRQRSTAAPAAMLAGGAVVFVASLALAVSPGLLPERDAAAVHVTTPQAEVRASDAPAHAPVRIPASPQLPPVSEPIPNAVRPAHEIAPPPAQVHVEAALPVAPVPTVQAVAPAPYEPPAVAYEPPAVAYEPPSEQFQPVPVVAPPAPVPAATAPIVIPRAPVEKPRLRDRILNRIPGLHRLSPDY